MVKVEIIEQNNNKIIKIDGKETSIDKYNNFKRYSTHPTEVNINEVFIFSQYPVLKEFAELGGDEGHFASKKKPGTDEYYTTEEYLAEMEKNGKVNRNLYSEIRNGIYTYKNKDGNVIGSLTGWKINALMETDDAARMKGFIEKNDKWIQENLPWFQEMVNKMKQFKQQLEDTDNDDFGGDHNDPNKGKTPEEKKQLAAKIEAYRNKVKEEIEKALNQDPKITSAELDPKYQSWQNQIWNTLITDEGEKEIDKIKIRVLNDISTKRAIKKAEKSNDKLATFKKEAIHDVNEKRNEAGLTNEDLDKVNDSWESEIMDADDENRINLIKARVLADIRNHKGKKDNQQKEKDQAKELAKKVGQATREEVNAMENSQLEESMQLFTRWEGESEFKFDEATADEIEKRLMETDPETYRDTIINALTERIHDYGISMNDVDDEIKKVIRGEINDVHQIKVIKDRAIKEIGTQGAKKKWANLMQRAKNLLTKAKENVTEKIKEDIKAVQKQIKSFKSGANTYLTSFYQSDKNNIEKMEKDLSSYSTASQKEPKGTSWGIIIPVSLAVVTLIGVVAVVIARKRKQQRIKK